MDPTVSVLCVTVILLLVTVIVLAWINGKASQANADRLAKLCVRSFDSALAISAEELERRRIDKPPPAPTSLYKPGPTEDRISQEELALLGMGITPLSHKPDPQEGVMVGGSPN